MTTKLKPCPFCGCINKKKDRSPFKRGCRVWERYNGFGKVKRNPKVPGTFACVVKWDKDSKLELVPGRFLWHASDPCLAIFGVEPEKEAKQ